MIAHFDHFEMLTDNIATLYFSYSDQYDYQPGQYAFFTLHGVKESYWYTLSSSPTEKQLAITTKYREPISEFKSTLKTLKPGDPLTISSAIGDFILPKDKSIPIVFISIGIGITPVRSILKWLRDNKQQRNIQLIYIVREVDDLIFQELINNSDIDYKPVITSLSDNENGMITPDQILSLAGYDENNLFFVSGVQSLVEDVCAELEKTTPTSKIIMDYFPGYNEL